MTAKRKLLVCNIVCLGCAALMLLILWPMLAYPKVMAILLLVVPWVSLLGGFLIRRFLHPFPKHRPRFSCYGLAGRIYGGVLITGLIGCTVILLYYGFVGDEAKSLFRCAFWFMVGLLGSWGVFIMYDQYRLAGEKDRENKAKTEGA